MSRSDEAPGSHKGRLEQAVRWLDEQGRDDAEVVAEACRRFDLSPADEMLLQRMWRERTAASHRSGKHTG